MMRFRISNIAVPVLVLISFLFYCYFLFGKGIPIERFTITSVANSVVFILIAFIIKGRDFSKKFIYAVLGAGLLFRILMVFSSPTGSDDIYRYIWDGKVFAAGVNPYKYNADDPALNDLHSEKLPAEINLPHYKTIYPPAAQIFFLTSYLIKGESVSGLKFLLLISEILTLIFIYLTLKLLKRNEKYILLYALCPLPVMQFMIDGHIDGLGIMFLSGFIYFYLKSKKVTSYLLLGFSTISKLISGMLIPVIFFNEKGRKRITAILVPASILAISYGMFLIDGTNPFESVENFAKNWMFNGSVFEIFRFVTHSHLLAREICGILFLVAWAVFAVKKGDFVRKAYYLFLVFFLLSTTVHPWYLTWLVLFFPFYPEWSGILFVSLVSLVNIDLIVYYNTGIWQETAAIHYIEYIPVYLMLIYEIYTYFYYRKKPFTLSVS